METPDEFEALAQACIDNHDEIMRYGSSEIQTASRMLLYAFAVSLGGAMSLLLRASRGTSDGGSRLGLIRNARSAQCSTSIGASSGFVIRAHTSYYL